VWLLFFSVACTLECPAQELILGEVGRCRSAAGRGGERGAAAADVERGARAEAAGLGPEVWLTTKGRFQTLRRVGTTNIAAAKT